jgi:HSP20 family protein
MAFKDLIPFGKKKVSIKSNNENPIVRFRSEMDHLFDDFFHRFELSPFFEGRTSMFNPRIDVVDTDKEIKVSAELPGMDEKDIEITLNRDSLTLKGKKKEEKEEKGKGYYRSERSYGSFSRTIPLQAKIESDKASAHFKKGVLTVIIPRMASAEEAKKRIRIHVD